MSWSERINTASSGSGRVDDIEGHLQGEIRGPTKLVKMRGRDEMDGQPEGARTRDAVESTEPMGIERDRWASREAEVSGSERVNHFVPRT